MVPRPRIHVRIFRKTVMRLESLTNSEIVQHLRDDPSMSEREVVLLDRITSMLDEVEALTAEVDSLLDERGDG